MQTRSLTQWETDILIGALDHYERELRRRAEVTNSSIDKFACADAERLRVRLNLAEAITLTTASESSS